MPQSAYRNFVGLAKIATATYITSSAAAGATTLTVASATGITTTSTVIILDGYNTEARAVSAVTGTTLTVAALTNAHPANAYLFVQPTASVGPTAYVPVKTFTVPDKIPQIYDETYRGMMGNQFSVAAGVRGADWAFGGDAFPDTVGYFLKALFGSEDFTTGPPNIHAFGVMNTGENALSQYGQPDYYAFYVYDGVNTHVVVGKLSELSLKLEPKSNVSYTAKLLARAAGVVSNPNASYSALTPIPSWRASLTLNSQSYRTPLSAEYTFSRKESEAIPTLQGTQDPYDIFVGGATGEAKYSFVKEDDSIRSLFQQGTQYPVSLALTQGSGSSEVGLTIQSSSVNTDDDEDKLQGKAYNTEDVSFTCLMNATDATTSGGGMSVAKVSLLNAVGSGVY